MFLSIPPRYGLRVMHTHDGGIDHLHHRVMAGGQRIHDAVPDACLPPTANERSDYSKWWGDHRLRQTALGST
jgi:hypothetical protein